MLTPDILVDIQFYDSDKNGRKSATPSDFFGCPFEIDGAKYDSRLLLSEIGSIRPGDFKSEVPVKFLCPDLVMPQIYIGKKFYLWSMGHISEGVVTKIIGK